MFDLGAAVALANTDKYAAYKVATWDDIPADLKDANGPWVNDYGGYMSIGYDSAKVPAPTSVADLLKADYKARSPSTATRPRPAPRSPVCRWSPSRRAAPLPTSPRASTSSRAHPGGQLPARDPTPPPSSRARPPLVIDWDYLNAGLSAKLPTWKVMVPKEAVVVGFYYQAINADAPNPAAARLWQEYLYSDEGSLDNKVRYW